MRHPLFARVASTAAVAAALSTPAAAQRAPAGMLTFTGAANAQDVGLPGVVLDFQTPATVVRGRNTGSFGFLNGRVGATTGTFNSIRVGNGPQSVPAFLTLGGYTFDLAYVPSGPYGQADCYIAPAPGQRCTPFQSVRGDPSVNDGLSPFYLANLASTDPNNPINSTASFNFVGMVASPNGASSYFVGTITSFFSGASYQDVLGGLEQAGDANQALLVPFTGTIVSGFDSQAAAARAAAAAGDLGAAGVDPAVVPEQATCALVGAGLVGAAGAARRRRRA